jgi:hypothetical protein
MGEAAAATAEPYIPCYMMFQNLLDKVFVNIETRQ